MEQPNDAHSEVTRPSITLDNIDQPRDVASNLSTDANFSSGQYRQQSIGIGQSVSEFNEMLDRNQPLLSQPIDRCHSFDNIRKQTEDKSQPFLIEERQEEHLAQNNEQEIAVVANPNHFILTTFDDNWEDDLKKQELINQELANNPLLSQNNTENSNSFLLGYGNKAQTCAQVQQCPNEGLPSQGVREESQSSQFTNLLNFSLKNEEPMDIDPNNRIADEFRTAVEAVDMTIGSRQNGQVGKQQINQLMDIVSCEELKQYRQQQDTSLSNTVSQRPDLNNVYQIKEQSDLSNQSQSLSNDRLLDRPNEHPQPRQEDRSNSESLVINVINCDQENSLIKNNDIYGLKVEQSLEPPHQGKDTQQQTKIQLNSTPNVWSSQQGITHSCQQTNENSETYQNKETQVDLNIRQKLQLSSNIYDISSYAPGKPISPQPPKEIDDDIKIQQRQGCPKEESGEANITKVIQSLDNLLEMDDQDLSKAKSGIELLQPHINLNFLRPLDHIGQSILSDGSHVIKFIQILLLKQTEKQNKMLLRRYLIASLSPRVKTNLSAFQAYRSLQLSIEPVNFESQSVQAHEGSLHQPRSNYKTQQMDIVEERVVKRTVATREGRHSIQSPRSGKETKKDRAQPNKKKGKTTTKKHVKNNLNLSLLNNQVASKYPLKSSENSNRKIEKQLSFLGVDRKAMQSGGSSYTYSLMSNSKNGQKELIQRRISLRVNDKLKESEKRKLDIQSESRSDKRAKRQITKSQSNKKESAIKQSSHKKLQQVSLDFVEHNLRMISFRDSMMEDSFKPLTVKDEEITKIIKRYNEQMQKLQHQERQSLSRQSHSIQIRQDPEDPVFEPQLTQQSASKRPLNTQEQIQKRKEVFRKELNKYKPSDVPVTIASVIDPNINNHGIYALVELGKFSQYYLNARYALSPIISLSRANKRWIEQDVSAAKAIVGAIVAAEKDNLVYLQPTNETLCLVERQHQKRQSQKKSRE